MSALEKIERWKDNVEAFVRDRHINTTIDNVFTEYTDEIVAANIILLRKGHRCAGQLSYMAAAIGGYPAFVRYILHFLWGSPGS